MDPAAEAVTLRTGNPPETTDPRLLLRLALTDNTEASPEEWDEVAGTAIRAVANGTAEPHQTVWMRARTGLADDNLNQALAAAALSNTTPSSAHRRLARLPQSALRRAAEWIPPSHDQGALVLRVVEALGKRTPNWISRYTSLSNGGSPHDGAYWLPSQPAAQPALARFLTEVEIGGLPADAALDELKRACRQWADIADQVAAAFNDDLTPALTHVSTWRQSAGAGIFADSLVAQTWAKATDSGWTSFSAGMALTAASLTVPRAPVPTREYSTENGYTAKFLQRSDPTGLVLGDLTDCCQRIGSTGDSCVQHGMTDPHGTFFAVRDLSGRVIAQSWAWFTEHGFCFDNIELLESGNPDDPAAGRRRAAIRNLYEQAARDLAPVYGHVTVGTGYTDTSLTSTWSAIDSGIPNTHLKYSDAHTQRSIAGEPGNNGLSWNGAQLTRHGTPILEATRDSRSGHPTTRVQLLQADPEAEQLATWTAGDDDLQLTHPDGRTELRHGTAPTAEQTLGTAWLEYQAWENSLNPHDPAVRWLRTRYPRALPQVFAAGLDVGELAAFVTDNGRDPTTGPSVLELLRAIQRGLSPHVIHEANALGLTAKEVVLGLGDGASMDDIAWAQAHTLALDDLRDGALLGLRAPQTMALVQRLAALPEPRPTPHELMTVMSHGYGPDTALALLTHHGIETLLRQFSQGQRPETPAAEPPPAQAPRRITLTPSARAARTPIEPRRRPPTPMQR